MGHTIFHVLSISLYIMIQSNHIISNSMGPLGNFELFRIRLKGLHKLKSYFKIPVASD